MDQGYATLAASIIAAVAAMVSAGIALIGVFKTSRAQREVAALASKNARELLEYELQLNRREKHDETRRERLERLNAALDTAREAADGLLRDSATGTESLGPLIDTLGRVAEFFKVARDSNLAPYLNGNEMKQCHAAIEAITKLFLALQLQPSDKDGHLNGLRSKHILVQTTTTELRTTIQAALSGRT